MKRSMKKYLMLLVAILSIMTMGVFAASAEEPTTECNHELYFIYYGTVHEPTCTSEGYTEKMCGNCNECIGREDPVPAKGHEYVWKYVATGDYYLHQGTCATCQYVKTESDSDNKPVIYYSIAFKNPAATASYIETIRYTKVVKERKGIEKAETYKYYTDNKDYTKDQELLYVKAGEEFRSLLPTSGPICEKDTEYGRYEFIGWFDKTDDPIILDSNPNGKEQLVAIANDGIKNYLDAPQEGEAEEVITENMVLYAGFRGVDTTYNVQFCNYDGTPVATSSNVHHGSAIAFNLPLPTKPADFTHRYLFSHWGDANGNAVDLDRIYDSITLIAVYNAPERQYNIEYYYDAQCTQAIYNNNNDKVKDDGVLYEHEARNGLAIDMETVMENKPMDDRYIYQWTGKWVLASRQDWVVDLNKFTVPLLTPDAIDGSTCVRLIPYYLKKERVYDLKVDFTYPDDNNYHPEEIAIQILYANGKIADTNTITLADGKDSYSYTTEVKYSEYYTIAISSTGYLGEKTSYFVSNSYDSSLSHPAGVIIELEKVGAYSCGCICHTIFKPIWIRVLNLLYGLFGIEHVCCSDMFANIGPNLNYGPGK